MSHAARLTSSDPGADAGTGGLVPHSGHGHLDHPGHTHDHRAAAHDRASENPARPRPPVSLLRMSLAGRLALVAALLALQWACVIAVLG